MKINNNKRSETSFKMFRVDQTFKLSLIACALLQDHILKLVSVLICEQLKIKVILSFSQDEKL